MMRDDALVSFCELALAHHKRPLGVLTTLSAAQRALFTGWPVVVPCGDELVYKGPLPRHCLCGNNRLPAIRIFPGAHIGHSILGARVEGILSGSRLP